MRLGDEIGLYCGIWEASQDKTLKNPLVAEA